ncbi:LysM peptidoglycan-binding domain-containing protein [Streptomyces sp. NPDC005794]|uniref:LysM peptidoglycan-binding domain-containing protein n=1 Tax=Streptomyces sp. NPDC005794 TaxID=3364733 RepID=UPI0036A35505
MVEASRCTAAAICRAHGWTAKSLIGHLEWSNDKVDPKGFAMASMRTHVAELLNEAANWSQGTSATYTVKKGDMLSSIARFGDAGRYKLANPSRIDVGPSPQAPPEVGAHEDCQVLERCRGDRRHLPVP